MSDDSLVFLLFRLAPQATPSSEEEVKIQMTTHFSLSTRGTRGILNAFSVAVESAKIMIAYQVIKENPSLTLRCH